MLDTKLMVERLIAGDEAGLLELVKETLDQGVAANEILNKGLIAGMDIVGDKMENEELFIPEVLMAAKAMNACVEMLKPLLGEQETVARAQVVIGTVKGDLHDIGKNLVAMMLQGGGMEVHNLGVDVAPDQFVAEVKNKNANVLCLSALLTTTMPMMQQTIEAIVEAGLRDRVKIMVGGAPVTRNFADTIGADGFAPDAGAAVKVAKTLIQ